MQCQYTNTHVFRCLYACLLRDSVLLCCSRRGCHGETSVRCRRLFLLAFLLHITLQALDSAKVFLQALRGLLGATARTIKNMAPSQASFGPTRPGYMRIAVAQFTPCLSDPAASRRRLLALTSKLHRSQGIDLLVAPEMAPPGYVFEAEEGKRRVRGMAERFGKAEGEATAHGVARELSQRLGCHTLIGYPEVVHHGDPEGAAASKPFDCRPTAQQIDASSSASSPPSPPPLAYYNSALLTSPTGEPLHSFRKHFLFVADESWSQEGPGFQHIDLTLSHNHRARLGVAICMDLNPYRFETTFENYELTRWAEREGVDVLAMPMAWLTNNDEENVRENAGRPDMDAVSYWATRCEPLWCGEARRRTCLVTANRTGKEGGECAGEV